MPLVGAARTEPPPNPLGGDEVALLHASYTGTQTDRHLFIGDVGNGRIVSVKLGYHAEERVPAEEREERGTKMTNASLAELIVPAANRGNRPGEVRRIE